MADTRLPEWWFYHLSRTTLEQAAGPLLEKCLQRGWRVLAVTPDTRRRARLDQALWTFSDDSFIAHGDAEAEGLDACRQPILLTGESQNLNQADVALLMDGAELAPDAPYTRCMVLFDGDDRATRDVARAQFKAAMDAGQTVRYFQQERSGGWVEAE